MICELKTKKERKDEMQTKDSKEIKDHLLTAFSSWEIIEKAFENTVTLCLPIHSLNRIHLEKKIYAVSG